MRKEEKEKKKEGKRKEREGGRKDERRGRERRERERKEKKEKRGKRESVNWGEQGERDQLFGRRGSENGSKWKTQELTES